MHIKSGGTSGSETGDREEARSDVCKDCRLRQDATVAISFVKESGEGENGGGGNAKLASIGLAGSYRQFPAAFCSCGVNSLESPI